MMGNGAVRQRITQPKKGGVFYEFGTLRTLGHAVDIREDKDCFTITADLPGVNAKEIEVHAENGMLTIRGERDSRKKEEREGYKRIERSYGSFFRRFTLPDTADTDKISAKADNGVLTVTIPKHEKLQPRKIAVEG